MKVNMGNFSGTWTLVRLILRRDRLILPGLFLFPVFMFFSIATTFVNMYSDPASRTVMVLEISNNPGAVAFLGSILNSSVGGLVAWRSAVIGPILVALVNIFLIIRHTRSEERKGRLELLNSSTVGRQSALTSALLTTFGANILMGLIITLSLIGLGLPWEGSLAMGFSMTLFGCLFAAIASLAAQLTENSSDVRYITVAVLIAFFLLRIVGWDNGEVAWLSWLSPLGWVHYLRAFAGEEWWVLGLFIVFIVFMLFWTYKLSSIRDVGNGFLPQRTGPARASSTLSSVIGLAWRIHRKMLFFWIIAFIVMGVILGYNAQTMTNIFNNNPLFMSILSHMGNGAEPLDSYMTLMLLLFGQVFAIYGILAALKLRSEEVKKHSEFLITNAVNRTRWAFSNIFFALIGPAMLLVIFILSYSSIYGIYSGMDQDLSRLLSAVLIYLPAIWVMVGVAVALFGFVPRLTSLTWVVLGFFSIINFLADFLDISQWIINISPFTHVPNLLLGDSVGWDPVLMMVLASVLISMGLIGFKRRDIT